MADDTLLLEPTNEGRAERARKAIDYVVNKDGGDNHDLEANAVDPAYVSEVFEAVETALNSEEPKP